MPAFSLGSEQKALVIILDDSLSMQRGKTGSTLFDQGKSAAAGIIDQLSDIDQAGLILPCSGLESELTHDRELVKKNIRAASPTWERAKIVTSIGRAEEMLARSGVKSKKILVITDLQIASFAEAITLGNFDGEVYFYDLGKADLENNLALGPVSISHESLGGEQSVKILASIYNFSDQPVEAKLDLWLGDQTVARGSLEMKSRGEAEKNFRGQPAGGHERGGQGGT